jgi:hypothetical protein
MSLGRAWTRQLFQASGAALLAPGAVLASLVVLAIAGGFGQLSALGQAFAGPSLPRLPGVLRVSGSSSGSAKHPSAVLVALAGSSRSQAVSSGAARNPGASAPAAQRGGGAPQPGTGGGHHHAPAPPPAGPGGHGKGPGPGNGGQPPPTGTPSPPPSPPPTVVDRVVGLGTSVTKQVPGPIGQIATQTLESVGHTLDGILSPPKGGAPGLALRLP